MDDNELVQKLRDRGYVIGQAVVRDDGIMLWLINDVFMFRRDAVDLASGAVTLEGVLVRNTGKVFPKALPSDYESSQAEIRTSGSLVARVIRGEREPTTLEVNVHDNPVSVTDRSVLRAPSETTDGIRVADDRISSNAHRFKCQIAARKFSASLLASAL